MKTDDLIAALSRQIEPAKPAPARTRLWLALAGGLVCAIALLVVLMGVRPDLADAMRMVAMKAGFSALAAGAFLPLTLRLLKPGAQTKLWTRVALGFFALSAGAAAVALLALPEDMRWQAWTGGRFPWCLVLVPLLATPCAAGLIWLARGLAPTRLAAAGAALGGLAGGIGAMAYAMYCPVDSVAFVATWYALAIGLCAAIGALIGSLLLRW